MKQTEAATRVWIVLVLLLVGAIGSGCGRGANAPIPVSEPIELRTYSVPPEHQQALISMLRSALEAEGNMIGRVSKGPAGTLLVAAPPRVQAGVEQILSTSFEAPPVEDPVKLTYWLVVGRPAEASGGGAGFTVAGRRDLSAIDSALTQIAGAQGPTEFSLLERIELNSMNQERAETAGRFARITQRASRRGEQVVAQVVIMLDENSFSSQIKLDAGQFLVLGQAGYAGRPGEAFADAGSTADMTLYYVMAANLEP